MKMLIVTLLGCTLAAGSAWAADKPLLKTQEDKVSYSIGLSVGRNLKGQKIDVNTEKFMLGLEHAIKDNPTLLTDAEMQEVMFAFQMERRAKALEEQTHLATENKKKGDAFLSKNKGQKGVKTTGSGLQYKVIKAGDGKSPSAESVVTAHYKGTFIDGSEFDSSYTRGQPAKFPVNGVIPGWSEVLQLMKVGAHWMVWIPSQLAYGEEGAGDRIAPNQTLVFEIELLAIEAPEAAAAPGPKR